MYAITESRDKDGRTVYSVSFAGGILRLSEATGRVWEHARRRGIKRPRISSTPRDTKAQ